MAYDKLNGRQLASEARSKLNEAENSIQAGMRRLDEIERRFAAGETPIPEPEPVPTPTPPPPPPPPPPPSGEGFADFDFADWVAKAGDHVDDESFPEGAFRFTGNVAKYIRADPIVYPNQAEAGHGHMVWGNLLLDGFSTHASLIAAGGSSAQGTMINRSAYWMPWLELEIAGQRLIWGPDYISNYYKMTAKSWKGLPRGAVDQVPLPEGLKLIFGNTMMPDAPSKHVEFRIVWDGGQVKSNVFADIAHEFLPGRAFYIAAAAPNFWNGEIDSPDHRSHVVYAEWQPEGFFTVPETHPHQIPQITYIPAWRIPEGVDGSMVHCASDMPGMPPLSNVHADFMDGWHPKARQLWFDNALMRQLNCSSCDFGNGQMGKRPAGFTFEQRPNLLPLP